jgi:hypothetical protein
MTLAELFGSRLRSANDISIRACFAVSTALLHDSLRMLVIACGQHHVESSLDGDRAWQ